jgi:gliding motility-associated-like protein
MENPALQAFSDFEVSIFNRYGQLIYHAKDNYSSWDGTYKGVQQPAGVYVYIIDLKQNIPVFKGTLSLIR